MASSDNARVLIGIGAVVSAAALSVLAFRAEPRPGPPDSVPSPAVLIAAAERGVDLTNEIPEDDRARLVGLSDAGETTGFDLVEFRNGLYLHRGTDAVCSGYLSETHPGGGPRLICCVVDGRLQGPSVELHPDGSLKRAMTHKDGEVVGQILEFYPNGELKLRAMVYEPTERGGSLVRELLVGEQKTGGYARRELGTGRIQFIYDNGTVEATNGAMPLNEIRGWMLFHDTLLGQDAYTSDSRDLDPAQPQG